MYPDHEPIGVSTVTAEMMSALTQHLEHDVVVSWSDIQAADIASLDYDGYSRSVAISQRSVALHRIVQGIVCGNREENSELACPLQHLVATCPRYDVLQAALRLA
jgi:hypothetical protein